MFLSYYNKLDFTTWPIPLSPSLYKDLTPREQLIQSNMTLKGSAGENPGPSSPISFLFVKTLAGRAPVNAKAFPSAGSPPHYTATHCSVAVEPHNTRYGPQAGFLNAVRGIERRPLSRRGNEISLRAVSRYPPQEVNAIIRITRHLSSRGGVDTKNPFLHKRRHKAQNAPDLGHCRKSHSKKKKKENLETPAL